MNSDDIKQIQADAEKATARTFRDAAEDDGWKPTSWTPDASLQVLEEEAGKDKKAK